MLSLPPAGDGIALAEDGLVGLFPVLMGNADLAGVGHGLGAVFTDGL